jgi:hypothetical protein
MLDKLDNIKEFYETELEQRTVQLNHNKNLAMDQMK